MLVADENRKGQVLELEEGKISDETAFEVSLMRQFIFCSLIRRIIRSVCGSQT